MPPRRFLVASLVVVALGASALAFAKDEKAKDDKKAAIAKGMSEYDKAITEAHKAFSAGVAGGALDDAIAGYRKAITVDPNRPEGHLYLGGALYQKGDYAAAEEALGQAQNRAAADKVYTNLQGKALMLLATVKEANLKPEEAKTAWKAYEDFAKANPDQEFPKGSGDAPPMAVKVFPASGVERQAKIDTYAKSVTEYAKVKDAILKRQKELGIDPTIKPSTTTAPPK
jgi:tetratricopeptide (TPR) repeat protein